MKLRTARKIDKNNTQEKKIKLIKDIAGDGSHYSIKKVLMPMTLLKMYFPEGEANELNFCLFSTSGVHGSYTTIEGEEKEPCSGITFLIIQPRLVTLQYGEVVPESEDDFAFLKKLRWTSSLAISKIGYS